MAAFPLMQMYESMLKTEPASRDLFASESFSSTTDHPSQGPSRTGIQVQSNLRILTSQIPLLDESRRAFHFRPLLASLFLVFRPNIEARSFPGKGSSLFFLILLLFCVSDCFLLAAYLSTYSSSKVPLNFLSF